MRTLMATLTMLLLPVAALQGGPPAGKAGGCCSEKVKSCCAAGDPGCGGAREGAESGATKGTTAAADDARAVAPAQGPVGHGMTAGEHGVVQSLLSGHDSMTRKVAEIPGGVRTVTTTSNPGQVATLRTHVRQMARHLEEGRAVRMWDPVFRGIFEHHNEVTLTFKDVPNGIEVTETSENPAVVKLIRAHAEKVNGFVAGGHAAARPPWAGGGRGRAMRGR